MRTGARVKPGQRGTKKLLQVYGEKLVCVRYRYDEQQMKRFKTVELIIDEGDWQPRPRPYKANDLVGLKIAYQETDLRNQVRKAGGIWNRQTRVWEIRYDIAQQLGLEARISHRISLKT